MEVKMETITITVTDDHLSRLREMASDFNVTLEELIHLSIENLLRPDAVFQESMTYVLNKNQTLYQRLATSS
jgi:hypothetical protein